jgi:hypothetical protein
VHAVVQEPLVVVPDVTQLTWPNDSPAFRRILSSDGVMFYVRVQELHKIENSI